MNTPIKSNLWKALTEQAKKNRPFVQNQRYSVSACNITLDYSNQAVNQETLDLLSALATACALDEKIDAMISGKIVNPTEQRPALHTALRAPNSTHIWVNDQNVMEEIIAARQQIQCISDTIRQKRWLGYSGKPITHIINIGIGGSDLGPKFCIDALSALTSPALGYRFISDADPHAFDRAVQGLNPETTLFLVSSKSFTTPETLYNARKALAWIGDTSNHQPHFIAITARPEKARAFGIDMVLPIWDWVGGRYSCCSGINLISAIALGFDAFSQLLQGAHAMDRHFQSAEYQVNLPVLLALLGIWNNNFLSRHTLLILTYSQSLEQLVPYIQQLDMESNGKSINHQGQSVHYATGPIVWGGSGNQAQHSYYQLLCQGTHQVAADFITLKTFENDLIHTMATSKINVLTQGIDHQANVFNNIPGQMPLNHIKLNELSPYTLGALIALYEHKIYTQSVIWEINPFDQPGIESAKHHAPRSKATLEPNNRKPLSDVLLQ